MISAYKEAPYITFTKMFSNFSADAKILVNCENINGEIKEVVEIETSAELQFKIDLKEDLTLKMEI